MGEKIDRPQATTQTWYARTTLTAQTAPKGNSKRYAPWGHYANSLSAPGPGCYSFNLATPACCSSSFPRSPRERREFSQGRVRARLSSTAAARPDAPVWKATLKHWSDVVRMHPSRHGHLHVSPLFPFRAKAGQDRHPLPLRQTFVRLDAGKASIATWMGFPDSESLSLSLAAVSDGGGTARRKSGGTYGLDLARPRLQSLSAPGRTPNAGIAPTISQVRKSGFTDAEIRCLHNVGRKPVNYGH
ncbi:hypothetical protein LZ31DRAFT_387774 [Colletotrichum somersetense]|nr:hypothetical protein LZ31DRAFT_387774 [Colletotrichum somersetense]